MTRWFWTTAGGTHLEEFVAVDAGPHRGRRVLAAVITKDGPSERVPQRGVTSAGKDIIVVQTKAMRLGMYLLGQAFFSARLVEAFEPRSIESVALCSGDDAVLRPLFEAYPNTRVVVAPGVLASAEATPADPTEES